MAEYILKKDLTINNIKEIHTEMISHIEKYNYLSVIIGCEIEVDFSGVQLLYAVKSYLDKINKSIKILYKENNKGLNPFALSEFEEILSTK